MWSSIHPTGQSGRFHDERISLGCLSCDEAMTEWYGFLKLGWWVKHEFSHSAHAYIPALQAIKHTIGSFLT
jgi:hypothetical protein